MHKRILALVSALALLAALTACGRRETDVPTVPPATETQTAAAPEAGGDIASPQQKPTAGTKTTAAAETQTTAAPDEAQTAAAKSGSLFQKYVRDKVSDGAYTLRTEQPGMKLVIAVDGSDNAVDSDAGLLRFALVHKDGNYYMIMHTSKRYTKMTEEEYKKQVSSINTSAVDFDRMRFLESGSETGNGKRYDTETYNEGEQGVVTYFFDDTGVCRTRVVRDGKTTETDVFAVSDDADAAAFEIPSDYTLVDDPAQILG